MNYHGQKRSTVEDVGSIALPEEVYHVVGTAPVVLSSPNFARHMVLVAEAANWRIKTGSFPSLASAAPSSSVTNGSGSYLLKEGEQLVIPAPTQISVVGPSSGAILTYFWS